MAQRWIAGIIAQVHSQLGDLMTPVQTALVMLDRTIVNGQRIIIATARVLLAQGSQAEPVIAQEVREVDPQALPADVLKKLEASQGPLTYEVSVGNSKKGDNVTRRLEVKRAE